MSVIAAQLSFSLYAAVLTAKISGAGREGGKEEGREGGREELKEGGINRGMGWIKGTRDYIREGLREGEITLGKI